MRTHRLLGVFAVPALTLLALTAIFRRGGRDKPGRGGGKPAPVDWLIVGLGNPGPRYAKTRHNVGYMVAERLIERHGMEKAKKRYQGLLATGRLQPGGARVAVLKPGTFMNESGRSVGPARGELRVEPDHIVVIHDEIDFDFGRVESRLGGGHGGHNGLKSLNQGLGTAGYHRVRVGVGRPDSTDPEIVSAWVLGGFREPAADVDALVDRALDEAVRVIEAADY